MGEDSIKKNISKNITKYREKIGMSQKEFSARLGVTPSRVSNWEQGANCPTIDILFDACEILKVSINDIYGVYPDSNMRLSYDEQQYIKRYRVINQHDHAGKVLLDSTMDYLYNKINESLSKDDILSTKDARIAELEAAGQTSVTKQIISLVDFQPHTDGTSRMVEYFRSASAGDGVFIMGNEGTEQVMIPNVPPEAREADYAIKISGISMEPDYHDGDVALVIHTSEMHYGDVGIFIINGNAYIKEYGREELISRNPESPNIKIAEHDNIVCMGKVVGKIREDEMVRV